MAKASVPVDLFNPGQVFACMGFLEVADLLIQHALGGFDWKRGCDVFVLDTPGDANPVRMVLKFLRTASVKWLSPYGDLMERDGGETEVVPLISPCGQPKAADLPGILRGGFEYAQREAPFGYWADASGRFATTFKKSTNGASSHVRFKNALDSICGMDPTQLEIDPFNQHARTESLFRLDPRGSVNPIEGGFSPDNLRKGGLDIRVATYPLCELLAVIGLQHARPNRIDSLHFNYAVWDRMLPPILARAALGGQCTFGGVRRFLVEHVEVKSGGDRRMNSIAEETTL